MNLRLVQLQEAMQSRFGVQAAAVDDALFLVRAHRNLAGIVLCCRRLTELAQDFPVLNNVEAISGYGACLKVLRKIAALDGIDPHFLGGAIERNKVRETPLRPFTGDSGLCDILLLSPGVSASGEQRSNYAWLQAWFAWQVFHYQHQVQSKEAFLEYLTSSEDRSIRLNHGLGSRVYGASRMIRELADPENNAAAAELAALFGVMDADTSSARAHLLAYALGERGGASHKRSLLQGGADADTVLTRQIADVRSLNHRLAGGAIRGKRPDLTLLSRFLQCIWLRKKRSAAGASGYISHRLRREAHSLDVQRYGSVIAIPRRVNVGDAHAGILVDIHLSEGVARERYGDDQALPADLDPEDPPAEPSIQLFLGDGDPTGAWYAAKSASHHVEADNALLRWPNWRLSTRGIAALLEIIESQEPAPWLVDRARLTLAISLVTGRRFNQAQVDIVGGEGNWNDRLVISLSDHVLHIPAARPQLKGHELSTDPLPKFCAPWAPSLRLPLPLAWHALVNRLADAPHARSIRVEQECVRLLRKVPADVPVTQKAIVHALKLALLETGRDDLALVKLLTDASDVNFDNLIHYASYPRAKVEHHWRKIVKAWAGPLAEAPPATRERERVGAPFGIDPDKVAQQLTEVKASFAAAACARRWGDVHNLLVIYVSLWLGMATAGRRTREPVPALISTDGWALVRDKRRPDESTDRYVPLSPALRNQLDVLRAWGEALGILDPEFSALLQANERAPPLRIFIEDRSVPFQPLHWDLIEPLRELPRNWGRRLIRSQSPELVGRFKDAGLGHWVRGRHPWSWTSTFPVRAFRDQWLKVQARMERDIGFEVLTLPALCAGPIPRTPCVPAGAADAGIDETETSLSSEAIEALLRGSSQHGEYEAIFEATPAVAEAARWLIERVLAERFRQTGMLSVIEAESLCRHVREHTRIPIFALRPRSRFQRNWMVSSDEFGGWLHVEQVLLPGILTDLSRLPAAELDTRVRIGRLLVAASLRASVLSSQHLGALLQFLASDRPIESVGEARMIELQVRSKRSKASMRRTLLLEPYFAALLVVEREALRGPVLTACARLDEKGTRRRNTCFQAYLGSLGLKSTITLSGFIGGLRQRVLLEAAPVLAGYASGELLTHDLPIAEFRRLAGLDPRRGRPEMEGELDQPSANEMPEHDQLPKDLAAAKFNLASRLGKHSSPLKSEWIRLIKLEAKRCKTPLTKLLSAFAQYMIESYAGTDAPLTKGRLSKRVRGQVLQHLQVVWAGLASLDRTDEPQNRITESGMQALMDFTAGHFSGGVHRRAWSRFRAFLSDRTADKADIEVDSVADSPDEFVSAKILSGAEMDRIERLLGSVQSNIGTEANRQAARNHFALTRAVGARRAEVDMLRWVDVDDEMLRIREYEGRTLKTPASERALPVGLLDPAHWSALSSRRQDGAEKVLDTASGARISGHNFFDKVARAMKQATGDPDIGLHHLRHTKGSLLTLRMLDNVVSLPSLDHELPWLASSLPPKSDVDTLLGSAGQSGQGLKAVSALLGHLHETTTLHHYIHTMGIALHAYHLTQPRIGLPGAFRDRLPGASSLYRYDRGYVGAGHSEAVRDHRLRDDIEALVVKRTRMASTASSGAPVVRRDDTPLRIGPDLPVDDDRLRRAQQAIEHIEAMQACLKEGAGQAPQEIDAVRERLRQIAAIRTGKRGSTAPRHPMPFRGSDGTPMATSLLAGQPVTYACVLIAWLLRLEDERRADFEWLLDRWLYASHAQTGAIRLTRPGDMECAGQLDPDPTIEISIRPIADTASRRRPGSLIRHQLLIGFSEVLLSAEAGTAKARWRSAGAVRWVMTWIAAIRGPLPSSNGP